MKPRTGKKPRYLKCPKSREKSRVAVDTRGSLGLVQRVGIFF